MYISDYTPVLNHNFSFQWDTIIIKQKLHTSIYPPHHTTPHSPTQPHPPHPSGICTCYILLGFETVSVERERAFSVVPDVYL